MSDEETKHEKHYPVWVKVAVVIVPSLISGVSSYLSARAEADAAKVKATLTYDTLVVQVNRLQEAAERCDLSQAKMEGRLDTVEHLMSRPAVGGLVAGAASRPSAPKPPPEAKAEFKQQKLPDSLEDLQMQMKAKK